MYTRELGKSGLSVSAIGLGCMGMSDFYGESDDDASIATLHRALDVGVSFWDTSDMYGTGRNEELLARVLNERRDEVELATKFGIRRGPGGSMLRISGRPEYVREACDASLKRLGVDHIDLYYQHRVDPEVPIEDTIGAMAELVAAGKIRHLGMSEASAATLRRAAAVHPIAALQSEYSLWTRDVEPEILPTCRELGIGLVPDSPLGRGFLTGVFTILDDFAEDDCVAPTHDSRARTSATTCAWSSASATSPSPRGARRPSSRWPGCWHRARTWCRSPAPATSRGSRKMPRRWTSR